jgi:hypothetical protein
MALEPQVLPPVTRQQSNCNLFDELKTPPNQPSFIIIITYLHYVFLMVQVVLAKS